MNRRVVLLGSHLSGEHLKILSYRSFRGPNIHTAVPVVELTVAASLEEGQKLGQAILAIQESVGIRGSFSAVAPAAEPGQVVVVAEARFPDLGRTAAEICVKEANGEPTDADRQRLKDIEYEHRLPVSTAVIADASRRRGIPVRRLSTEYGRLLIHGHGTKQHRTLAAEPDSISILGRTCSTDKQLAKELMAAAGVPVPVGRAVTTLEEAWQAAQELGFPVAVKPQDSDLQIGVSLDVRTREHFEAAFQNAVSHSGAVLVERFAPGVEHRVLVVDGKIAAVTRIDPPQVLGDGVHTIAELVAEVNRDPRRGDEGSDLPWHKIALDEEALGVIAKQGFTVDSVPPAGKKVLARRNPPYFANGGNFVDVSDDIHPATAAHAAAAAESMQLSVAGLDVVVLDIREPLEPQGGVVVEINAGPGLWLHLAPSNANPRPVGDAIVASMFPPGESGRIPVIALVGEGSETFRECLERLCLECGKRLGYTKPGEAGMAGRRWPTSNDPFERAEKLLQFPALDVVILETTAEELLRDGFGNDRCDIAVSLGETNEIALRVLKHALVPGGAWVAGVDVRTAASEAARSLGIPSDC